MSEKEQIIKLLDTFPDYKIGAILTFIQGMNFDEDLEEDAYCESLVEGYLNDTSEDKHDTVTIEEFAKSEGIMLSSVSAY